MQQLAVFPGRQTEPCPGEQPLDARLGGGGDLPRPPPSPRSLLQGQIPALLRLPQPLPQTTSPDPPGSDCAFPSEPGSGVRNGGGGSKSRGCPGAGAAPSQLGIWGGLWCFGEGSVNPAVAAGG